MNESRTSARWRDSTSGVVDMGVLLFGIDDRIGPDDEEDG
jgi:hypothetical protein